MSAVMSAVIEMTPDKILAELRQRHLVACDLCRAPTRVAPRNWQGPDQWYECAACRRDWTIDELRQRGRAYWSHLRSALRGGQ